MANATRRNNKPNNLKPVSAKKALTFRNNVNVRNVIYTKKNGTNNYNRSVVNSKNTIRARNGPGNYKHTRNYRTASAPPEWSVGESYYTAQGMAAASKEYLRLRQIFGNSWSNAEVYIADHPDVMAKFNKDIAAIDYQYKQHVGAIAKSMMEKNELPKSELTKYYRRKMKKAETDADNGLIDEVQLTDILMDLKFKLDAAIDAVKPGTDAEWKKQKENAKRYFEYKKTMLARKLKEEVLTAEA